MKSIQSLVVDIETLPDGEYPSPSDIKVPANYKNEASILKFQNDPVNLEKAYRARALDPFSGRILCISWKLDDEPIRSSISDDEQIVMEGFESQLRQQFLDRFNGNPTIAYPTVIGHNIKFDMGFLFLRFLKYNHEWLLSITSDTVKDLKLACTMKTMAVLDPYKTYVSLDKSCGFFGIDGKSDGITGADVYPMYKEGKLDEIRKYCERDVEACYSLAKRLRLIFE